MKAIEFLSTYIAEKDYKSKSHYLTIRRWVFDAVDKEDMKPVPKKKVEFGCSGYGDAEMEALRKLMSE